MALGQMELAAAILDIVPHLDAEVATIRIIMQKLADHFGVDYEAIRKQKEIIKQLVVSSYDAEPEHDRSADKENHDRSADKENHDRQARESTAARAAATVVKKRAQRLNVISDESDADDSESEQSDNASDEDEVEEHGSSENESDSGSDAPRKLAKRVRASRKSTPVPAKKQRVSADSPGFAALKELARAARLLSPRVYSLLKKLASEQEQEEHVRELLKRHGIRFNGRYPQKREIESVRRKTEMARDLEGIDTSLIIDEDTSTRPRRAARGTSVSYTDQLINHSESEEEDGGDDGSGDDATQAKRAGSGVPREAKAGRARKRRANESESDAGEGNGSESSSEAEF